MMNLVKVDASAGVSNILIYVFFSRSRSGCSSHCLSQRNDSMSSGRLESTTETTIESLVPHQGAVCSHLHIYMDAPLKDLARPALLPHCRVKFCVPCRSL